MNNRIFEGLFGSKVKIKILKLFFRNDTGYFDIFTISRRIQEKRSLVKKELTKLTKIGVIKLIQKRSKLGYEKERS